MCGILFTNIPCVSQTAFLNALRLMDWRGPDASGGYYESGVCKLGHNRLSILDPSPQSNQPFFSDDGKFVIIFNGEIYNYRELAKKYDITLRTRSDTELILRLSLQLGFEAALNLFNGIFSYIIFSTQTSDFFVARDRLGVKPLYMYQNPGGIILSSEVNSILALTGDSTPDPVGLRQYRKLRTFFNGHTFYKSISMFPAGSFLRNGTIQAYWSFPEGEQSPPDDDELRFLIESSIEYRKISDVPIGSFLSGGLDSTIVAALTKELHTWTIGFEDNNEFEWGRLASKHIGSQHHEILITNELFKQRAAQMISLRREPLSVPNEVLLYSMSCALKEINTVMLCGEGADELFFGYDRIFRWAETKKSFDIKEFSHLYAYGSEEDYEIVESVVEPFYKFKSPVAIAAAFFQIAHLHGLLRRLDSATMLCSVEAREPFVDYRLVERLAGVSINYRMSDGVVKAPLKRVFSDIVPKEIIDRPKLGFPVNLGQIFDVPEKNKFDAWFSFNIDTLACLPSLSTTGGLK